MDLEGGLRVVAAQSACLQEAAGADWLAVGDAAAALDPLSGQGICTGHSARPWPPPAPSTGTSATTPIVRCLCTLGRERMGGIPQRLVGLLRPRTALSPTPILEPPT